jgi:hypothetical protein
VPVNGICHPELAFGERRYFAHRGLDGNGGPLRRSAVALRPQASAVHGHSFTEALGVAYEESFVGRFAAAFPQLDVLNGGVSGYAPSVYYAKASSRKATSTRNVLA